LRRPWRRWCLKSRPGRSTVRSPGCRESWGRPFGAPAGGPWGSGEPWRCSTWLPCDPERQAPGDQIPQNQPWSKWLRLARAACRFTSGRARGRTNRDAPDHGPFTGSARDIPRRATLDEMSRVGSGRPKPSGRQRDLSRPNGCILRGSGHIRPDQQGRSGRAGLTRGARRDGSLVSHVWAEAPSFQGIHGPRTDVTGFSSVAGLPSPTRIQTLDLEVASYGNRLPYLERHGPVRGRLYVGPGPPFRPAGNGLVGGGRPRPRSPVVRSADAGRPFAAVVTTGALGGGLAGPEVVLPLNPSRSSRGHTGRAAPRGTGCRAGRPRPGAPASGGPPAAPVPPFDPPGDLPHA
jgi:hypothetical protein